VARDTASFAASRGRCLLAQAYLAVSADRHSHRNAVWQ